MNLIELIELFWCSHNKFSVLQNLTNFLYIDSVYLLVIDSVIWTRVLCFVKSDNKLITAYVLVTKLTLKHVAHREFYWEIITLRIDDSLMTVTPGNLSVRLYSTVRQYNIVAQFYFYFSLLSRRHQM